MKSARTGSFHNVIKLSWTWAVATAYSHWGMLHQLHWPHSLIAAGLHAGILRDAGRGWFQTSACCLLSGRWWGCNYWRLGLSNRARERDREGESKATSLVLMGRPGRKEKLLCLFIWFLPQRITHLHKPLCTRQLPMLKAELLFHWTLKTSPAPKSAVCFSEPRSQHDPSCPLKRFLRVEPPLLCLYSSFLWDLVLLSHVRTCRFHRHQSQMHFWKGSTLHWTRQAEQAHTDGLEQSNQALRPSGWGKLLGEIIFRVSATKRRRVKRCFLLTILYFRFTAGKIT